MSCSCRQRSESFGLVALEAAACGTPVVAAAVGGLLTLVDHGHTGFLVDGRDPEVYAAYTAELIDNEPLAWEIGVSAAAQLASLYVVLGCGAPAPVVCRPQHRGAGGLLLMSELLDDGALDALEAQIDSWLAAAREGNPAIAAIDRGEPGARRWYVRMIGEEKDVTTIWLTLGQRTLRYETYVMPAPEENTSELYEHLLRRNDRLVGAHFSVGAEDAVFLRGELPLALLDEQELDRVIGTLYATVEQCFRAALRIGFASRFRT